MGRPAWGVIAVLAVLFVAYAVDGLNSYLHLEPLMRSFPNLPRPYEPNNTLRLLTGTGIGLVIGAALYPSFNSTVWRRPDPRPALGNLASAGRADPAGVGTGCLAAVGDSLDNVSNGNIECPGNLDHLGVGIYNRSIDAGAPGEQHGAADAVGSAVHRWAGDCSVADRGD